MGIYRFCGVAFIFTEEEIMRDQKTDLRVTSSSDWSVAESLPVPFRKLHLSNWYLSFLTAQSVSTETPYSEPMHCDGVYSVLHPDSPVL